MIFLPLSFFNILSLVIYLTLHKIIFCQLFFEIIEIEVKD